MKKNQLKRSVTLLTIVALLLGIFPATVFADETEETDDPYIEEITFEEEEETVESTETEIVPTESSEETFIEETEVSEEEIITEETTEQTDDVCVTEETSLETAEQTEDVCVTEETSQETEILPSESVTDIEEEEVVIETEPSEEEEETEPVLFEVTDYYVEGLSNEVVETVDYVEEVDDTDVLAVTSPVYNNFNDAVAFIRAQMVNRETSVALKVDYDKVYGQGNTVYDIVEEAMKHTGVAGEGDNLSRQFEYWSSNSSVSYDSSNKRYILTYSLSFAYYTTKAQEAALRTAADNLIKSLNLTGKSNYEKIYAVYSWMTENIDYDYEHLNDESYYLQYTAYAGLVKGTCVCQGYANLFYYLMLKLGINCRMLSGANHEFNIVNLGGKYYYVDATWDEDHLDGYGFEYFLLGSEKFLEDHSLYTYSDFNMEALAAKYNISKTDYFVGLNPGTLSATYVSGGIKLSWAKVNGATGYIVSRYDTSTKSYKQVANVSSNTTTIPWTTASKGTFKVVAYQQAGYDNIKFSKYSTKSINLDMSNFKAVSSDSSSVKLSWDSNSNIQCYEIWRATSEDGPYTKINTVSASSYTNTGLTAGKAYYYKVRGYVSFNGTKHYGAYTSVQTSAPKLYAPSFAYAEDITSSTITLKWDPVSYASGYEIWRATSQNGPYACIATGITSARRECGSLDPSTTYYFMVRAYRKIGNVKVYGYYTDEIALTTAVGITNIGRNSSTGASFYIEWKADPSGVEGYEVSRATSENGPYTVIGSTRGTRFVDTGRTVGTKYYYRVRSYSKLTSGTIVYRPYGNPRAIMVPKAPSGLSLSALSTSQIKLSWKGVAGGSNIYYEVWRSTSSNFSNAVCIGRYSTTSCTSKSLSANTRYYYRVRAYYRVATSDANNPKRIYSSYTSISSCTTKKS